MTSTSTTPVIFDCAQQSNTGQYIEICTAKFLNISQCQPVRLRAILSGVAIFDEMVEVKDKQILFSDIPFFANFPYAKNSYWVFQLYSENNADVAFELKTSNALELPNDYLQNTQKPIGDTGMYVNAEVGNLYLKVLDNEMFEIENRPIKRQVSNSQFASYDNNIPLPCATVPFRT